VEKREPQRSMYELSGASTAQRLTMAVSVGIWVLLAWWMLAGGGLDVLGAHFEWMWREGDVVRRFCLAAGFSVYYLRILFTEFVFLKRGVSWNEALTIAVWLLFIVLLLGLLGGTNEAPMGTAGIAGIVLYVLGSWVNSHSEYARHVWKRRRENTGRLYTGSFFRYSRHPNYLGDLLLFSGLCLISGAWVTMIVPVLMLAGFVFINIPVLDAHLRDHYGSAFDEYARRTHKLIPFVY
jgi:protein-S-isoprenylcysteine O-methyltransferase Ste14